MKLVRRLRSRGTRDYDSGYRFRTTRVLVVEPYEPPPAPPPPIAPSVPVPPEPPFEARRRDVLRALDVSDSTLYRWQAAGLLWEYDPDDAPDGHYIVLPGGRKRFSIDRVRSAGRTQPVRLGY